MEGRVRTSWDDCVDVLPERTCAARWRSVAPCRLGEVLLRAFGSATLRRGITCVAHVRLVSVEPYSENILFGKIELYW